MEHIKENLERLKTEIAKICDKHKRPTSDITLVAVSKTFPPEAVVAAYACGHRKFGENRPQSLRDRFLEIKEEGISWHLVGALQKNKFKYVVGKTALIHSIDSAETALGIDEFCRKRTLTQDILIEVNTSGEWNKMGVSPALLPELLEATRSCQHIRITGLMTMAPLTSNEKVLKKSFSTLRTLRDTYQKSYPELKHLSMGMSNDFQIALGEGATILRIGTAIFGARTEPKTFRV